MVDPGKGIAARRGVSGHWGDAVYRRVRQFIRAMSVQATLARVQPAEYALVEERIPPAQRVLFRQMDRCDQRHCLDVFCALYEAGYRDQALLFAALIHDVGKSKSSGRLTVWHRVAVVLMHRFAPGWLAHLAADGRGWKAPFAVHVQHARLGAQQAAAAGCSPDVVDLIRKHHDPDPKDERLAALQWADVWY